jgi:multidrug resistance efflux pump
MRNLIVLALFTSQIWAQTHYARLLPFESYSIKAATSGLVKSVDRQNEGKAVVNRTVVQLDDAVDRVQLQALQTTLEQVQSQIKINEDILQNLEQSLQRQAGHYERVESLDTRPQAEKDSAFYNYVNAKNQYLQTKEKLASLREKEASTKHSVANLKDVIDKKSFNVSGYVHEIAVTEGDYLNPGAQVMSLQDISKAKLELFLAPEEIEATEVFIEGKKHEKGFDKIWKVTDDTHISSYKAQIVLEQIDGYRFGQLLKVEVK